MCINHLNASTILFTRMCTFEDFQGGGGVVHITVNNNNTIDRINERKEVCTYVGANDDTNITRIELYCTKSKLY